MGRTLATLTLLTIPLGGCSKLYDPDRLAPAADAALDTGPPPDADNPMLEGVTPSIIFEGSGVGGSRPAVLVLTGTNLVPSNMSVTITASEGSTKAPMFTIEAAKVEVAANGFGVAVPITLPVDIRLGENDAITLDVKVTQDGSAGPVSSPLLTGQLTLRGLEELVDSYTTPIPAGGKDFSKIDLQTRILAPSDKSGPLIVRSRSSVKISKPISVNGDVFPSTTTSKSLGGPGAGNGGLGGNGLGGSGEPGTGPYPGQTPSAPGRFESPDLVLSTLGSPNRGSGGAGGNAAVALGRGGRGGGGGGSIAISADGDLQVDKITAQGTPGESGAGLGGADGGGGSGGVILVRAGGALIASDLNVNSGGGTGQVGRARYDAGGSATVVTGALGADHYRGPMFASAPLVTRSKTPEITVAGKPLSTFGYFTINAEGRSSQPVMDTVGPSGTLKLTLKQSLDFGLNQLCLLVAGATVASDTRNCVDLAYLP